MILPNIHKEKKKRNTVNSAKKKMCVLNGSGLPTLVKMTHEPKILLFREHENIFSQNSSGNFFFGRGEKLESHQENGKVTIVCSTMLKLYFVFFRFVKNLNYLQNKKGVGLPKSKITSAFCTNPVVAVRVILTST